MKKVRFLDYLGQECARKTAIEGKGRNGNGGKIGTTPSKVTLCIWQDWEDAAHYELFHAGSSIESAASAIQGHNGNETRNANQQKKHHQNTKTLIQKHVERTWREHPQCTVELG